MNTLDECDFIFGVEDNERFQTVSTFVVASLSILIIHNSVFTVIDYIMFVYSPSNFGNHIHDAAL